MIDIFRLFAKTQPYVSLFEHCCDVGKAAGILWDYGVINQKIIAREQLCLLAALHDIGKCHPDFQRKGLGVVDYADELYNNRYLPANERKIRHEIITASIINARQSFFANKTLSRAFARILRLHHQKQLHDDVQPWPQKEAWLQAQEQLLHQIEKYFKVSLKDIFFKVSDNTCTMLWGAVVLADWLVSGNLGDRIEQLFSYSILPAKPLKDMFKLPSLRPLQEKCEAIANNFENSDPSLIIIEAPMGEGKTEAALFLATQLLKKCNKKGIYVALPTTATARQMESRVSALLSSNNIDKALLVHSEAWLEKEVHDDEEIDKSWFAPTKRSLLSNYAVGTVDQAMMAVLRVKQGVLRLLGLSSKVLIIDEIHAYDTYMQTIIFRLLEWCKAIKIPVIMLSATLPNERKQQLLKAVNASADTLSVDYPLITTISSNGTVNESGNFLTYMEQVVKLTKHIFTDYGQVGTLALDATANGGCICIIMNTVKDAQEVYQSLKENSTVDTLLLLFHSRFLNKDRKKIEEQCLNSFGKNGTRPPKAILVATQVAEQSLDLDFDYMISALAPIDLLLQRCGRLHRHARCRPAELEQPQFAILINGNEMQGAGIGRVYRPWILYQTQQTIGKIQKINLPHDIKSLVEEVYSATPAHQDIQDIDYQEWLKIQNEDMFLEGKAESIVYPSPEDDWFFPLESNDFFEETEDLLVSSETATRLGRNNIKIVLLPKELYQKNKLKECDIAFARAVLKYSVSLNPPFGYNLSVTDDVVECGGYLKGLYAIPYQETFQLTFKDMHKTKTKKYSISAEYGLKEEE